jgi:hypothetical protein
VQKAVQLVAGMVAHSAVQTVVHSVVQKEVQLVAGMVAHSAVQTVFQTVHLENYYCGHCP